MGLALYGKGSTFAVQAVTPVGSNRPWARNALEADETGEVMASRSSTSRPADATPSMENLPPEDQ